MVERIGMHVHFDDSDARVLAYLAEHFHQHEEHFTAADTSTATQFPIETVNAILERFERYQMVSRETRGDSWNIEPQLLSVADQLRAPSPGDRDYPKEIERWFRSKWWSVPVWVLLVVLPALVGYITMICKLLEWFSITKE